MRQPASSGTSYYPSFAGSTQMFGVRPMAALPMGMSKMNSRIYRRHTRVSFRDVPAHERFWRNVDTTGGPSSCWLWTGTLTREGYARFRGPGKRQWLVHRYSFFIHRGISLPPSIPLDHICHNADKSCNLGNKCRHRSCVNPAHLE